MSNGFFKVYHDLFDDPLWKYTNSKQHSILMVLLNKVSYKPNTWLFEGRPCKVKKDELLTSLESLAKAAGKDVSVQNVRTALKLFENVGFLTNKSTKSGRLIKITKWSDYKEDDEETNKETNKDLTKSQQRPNKDLTTIKKVRSKKVKSNNKYIYSPAELDEIISYLNLKTDKHFKTNSEKTKRLVNARFKEGYRVDDFKKVIDIKCSQWLNDEKMNRYLQPSTLFSTKFENYLNEKVPLKVVRDSYEDEYKKEIDNLF